MMNEHAFQMSMREEKLRWELPPAPRPLAVRGGRQAASTQGAGGLLPRPSSLPLPHGSTSRPRSPSEVRSGFGWPNSTRPAEPAWGEGVAARIGSASLAAALAAVLLTGCVVSSRPADPASWSSACPRPARHAPVQARPAHRPGPLPESPSRQDVGEALRQVNPAVQECLCGLEGDFSVAIEFGPDGSVRDSRVLNHDSWLTTPSFPADAIECALHAVRQARIPPFRRESMLVNLPFRTRRR